MTPNDLRRTFASWLKQRGVDSMIVARLLGHTTSRMVELVYGHLNDNSLIDAVSALPGAPKTGNIRVTDTSVSVRQKRQMRQPDSDNFTLPLSAQGRNRTTDTRIFSPLLYRLSYLGLSKIFRRLRPAFAPSTGRS